jgi:hypothetical protein
MITAFIPFVNKVIFHKAEEMPALCFSIMNDDAVKNVRKLLQSRVNFSFELQAQILYLVFIRLYQVSNSVLIKLQGVEGTEKMRLLDPQCANFID